MSYSKALEAAGAKVIEFKEIGSYQGTWGAIVECHNIISLIIGSYGSCSGCDAFLSEFGYDGKPEERDGKYYKYWGDEITKAEYDILNEEYNKKLSDFGMHYLTTPLDKSDIVNKIASFKEDDWFDQEEIELYEWALTFYKQD